MRISVLGCIPIVCIALSSPARGASDDDTAAAAPPAATSAPPASKPASAPDTLPSPRPLAGPLAGPLPPEEGAALPPLPASAPQIYEAPLPPPPPQATPRSEWGAQFRVEAAPMIGDASSSAAMGGIGFSLRPRPSPYFAVDFGLDFIGGRDFNGDSRSESAFTVNPMLFLNPRNKVQIYLLAGLGLGAAEVRRGGVERHYSYVGADAGAGVELRFWRRVAFSGDVVAFVRDRSDPDAWPEYLDPATRRYTNSSAGALLRLGGTYYW